MTYLWYDFETDGHNPGRCRPCQFAAIRTDENLEPVGEPISFFCRPSPDTLTSAKAVVVHGHSPRKLQTLGVSEAKFAERILAELQKPATCSVAFNGMQFDHTVTRFLLYRCLRDPYKWHWDSGCSRWDIIDIFRAARLLRPDGIEWPIREDGSPSFRLQDLAAANGVLAEQAHDALDDVRVTIELARLLRRTQPRLYEYAQKLRDREFVAQVAKKRALIISPFIPARAGSATITEFLLEHPTQSRNLVLYDLRRDPTQFLGQSAEEMLESFYTREKDLPEGKVRPPFLTLQTNASPFVAQARMADAPVLDRLGVTQEMIDRHAELLHKHRGFFVDRARSIFQSARAASTDVDYRLYDNFTPDSDRRFLEDRHEDGDWAQVADHPFKDERLPELVFRFRARNYSDSLSPVEQKRWREHCRSRLMTPDVEGKSAIDRVREELQVEREQLGVADPAWSALDELENYIRELEDWLTQEGGETPLGAVGST